MKTTSENAKNLINHYITLSQFGRQLALLSLLLFSSTLAFGQVTLRGVILDEHSKEPIPFAHFLTMKRTHAGDLSQKQSVTRPIQSRTA